MPGKFHVKGTLVLEARNRLVIYGDIVAGTVKRGEELSVPLYGDFAMTIPIESVEAVDGTPTGSHVALVVDDDDELGQELILGLELSEETLVVETAD